LVNFVRAPLCFLVAIVVPLGWGSPVAGEKFRNLEPATGAD
jgi:hypothetical protein